jgi:WD40 repeat protein
MLEIFNSVELGDVVRSLAFTPDGTALAAAGGNTGNVPIRIWDAVDGHPLALLGGHNGIVWGMAFSPDGRMLATVSSDQTAQIHDWRNGDILKVLTFPGQVVSVAFSPDGQTLAVGGVDEPLNQIQNAAVWTYAVGSWELRLKLTEFLNITALAFSPGGGTLVGGGTSRNVQVWRTGDGSPQFTLSHAHQVSEAAISPDGSTVATATCLTTLNADCTEGGIWLWDLPSGKLIRKIGGFPDFVESVAFSVDGSTLIAGSRDGTLRLYAASDYETHFETFSPGGIDALALSPDGTLLATGGSDGRVHLWKVLYRP